MKENEVPDRIWVHELSAKELNVPLKEYHVEYIRKDAFIEKACEYWYKYNRDVVVNKQSHEFTVNVEDFKKYLKGE